MIKFFRNIRQKALTDNRIGKYFTYAIGEIVLVVIGILIALQINNWKEEKRQEVSEKEFFDGLTKDLNRDSEVIKVTMNDIDRRLNSFDLLNNQGIVHSKEIIDSLMLWRTMEELPHDLKEKTNTFEDEKGKCAKQAECGVWL